MNFSDLPLWWFLDRWQSREYLRNVCCVLNSRLSMRNQKGAGGHHLRTLGSKPCRMEINQYFKRFQKKGNWTIDLIDSFIDWWNGLYTSIPSTDQVFLDILTFLCHLSLVWYMIHGATNNKRLRMCPLFEFYLNVCMVYSVVYGSFARINENEVIIM